MEKNIIQNSSASLVKGQFSIYGEYTNLHRHVPYLFDGLKPSYRRLIMTALEIAPKELVKSATLIGHCIGHYHPHGDQSVEPIVAELVNIGVFRGQGNFGMKMLYNEDATPAAPRYTEAGLSKIYYDLFAPVIKFVPKFLNDLGNEEYEYLPTPIPIGLLCGYLGIGVGTGCRIPAFTPKSILQAYANNDPNLLENFEGVPIMNRGELMNLWQHGRGRIRYALKVRTEGKNVVIEGNRGPLKLDYSWFEKFKKEGRVKINDYSSAAGKKVVIEKMPNLRYPTTSDILKQAQLITKGIESYYVRCVYENQVRDIGLYDWIDITYKNYARLYKKYLDDEIKRSAHQIEVFKYFRPVADQIINKTTSYEDIAKGLKIDVSIVREISQKSINTLRNSDPSKKIDELNRRIESLKKTNIDEKIVNAIMGL